MPLPRSPREFRELLAARGIKPRRDLGQNFLVDGNFLDALARDFGFGPGDEVVEIGTGAGHLTDVLCRTAGRVWSFDVDAELQQLARELLGPRPNLELILADGAEFDRHVKPDVTRRLHLVSNLPYRDWSRLLVRMMSSELPAASIHVMVQADAADRILAGPGTKSYGPMGVLVLGLYSARKVRNAGPRLFHPAPKVESVVLKLERAHRAAFDCRPVFLPALHAMLKLLFVQRRKRLRAALEAIEEGSREPLSPKAWTFGDQRVEDLPPDRLLTLAALLV